MYYGRSVFAASWAHTCHTLNPYSPDFSDMQDCHLFYACCQGQAILNAHTSRPSLTIQCLHASTNIPCVPTVCLIPYTPTAHIISRCMAESTMHTAQTCMILLHYGPDPCCTCSGRYDNMPAVRTLALARRSVFMERLSFC